MFCLWLLLINCIIRLPDITLSDVEALRQAFPDLAKSLSLPEEGAFQHLLEKSLSTAMTAEDDATLYQLRSMPDKVDI